jgi:hypothetical protein
MLGYITFHLTNIDLLLDEMIAHIIVRNNNHCMTTSQAVSNSRTLLPESKNLTGMLETD